MKVLMQTAARSAAKFYMTIHQLILHVVCKQWPPTTQGQVTRLLGMTQHQVFLFCIFITVPEPQLMTNHFETRRMA